MSTVMVSDSKDSYFCLLFETWFVRRQGLIHSRSMLNVVFLNPDQKLPIVFARTYRSSNIYAERINHIYYTITTLYKGVNKSALRYYRNRA